MYRECVKDVFETRGENLIIIVCNKGIGLKDFKILNVEKDWIKVRYTALNVKAPIINLYRKNAGIKQISQVYYVVDVKKRKITRVPLVSIYSNFPKKRGYISFPIRHRKMAISLCLKDNINLMLHKGVEKYEVISYDEDGNKVQSPNATWIERDGLPKTFFLLDFQTEEVQKVQQVTFLN